MDAKDASRTLACRAWWNDPENGDGFMCERVTGHEGPHRQAIEWPQETPAANRSEADPMTDEKGPSSPAWSEPSARDRSATEAVRFPCCDHCREEEGGCDWNDRHHAPCPHARSDSAPPTSER